MSCLWHGEEKFIFSSLGKRKMFGDGEGSGEGFLSVACLPWESLCCFGRGWLCGGKEGCSGTGKQQTPWTEGLFVPSLMLLVIGHPLGLPRFPGMLQYLNYRLGERNERFLWALLGIPAHLLLGLCWCLRVEPCWKGFRHGGCFSQHTTPCCLQGQEGSWTWHSSHVLPFLTKWALIYQDLICSYC